MWSWMYGTSAESSGQQHIPRPMSHSRGDGGGGEGGGGSGGGGKGRGVCVPRHGMFGLCGSHHGEGGGGEGGGGEGGKGT